MFFAVDSQHPKFECIQNVCNSQSYVSEYALHDYPITEADILSKGDEAWNASLNTVNIGKYNLGWASIGMCTHAFYEAINHAANRRLYNMSVTDFPHVQQNFTDAYVRLVAMKLVALRAADYMRSACAQERIPLVTTNVIIAEVHRFVLFRIGIQPAALLLDRIDASALLTIEFVTAAHHAAARRWLARLPDQVITYTDAVSFAVMEATGCTAVMSFDHDFVTAGFRLWQPQ